MIISKCDTIIESLGVYLPPKKVSTRDVLRACKKPVRFPLEYLTGIKFRHMAGDGEFSVDLARKAVTNCLSNSRYCAADIDLLVCCNISRYDGPNFRFSFEPNTSIKLKHYFGFDNALAFDITNACAGMFTAIYIVDAFIKAGAIQRGMVVSGEYISHLTITAQKEIEEYMDPRLACLTLGDAGAAMILEKSPDDKFGFHEIELYTLGRYSSYCIAQATDKEHGGAIMYTDALNLSAVSIDQAVAHSAHIIEWSGWSPEAFQHLIMHQTSKRTLNDAMREINRFFNRQVCHEGNTIFNLADRGNTATTSHAVALMDNTLNNRIRSGDNAIFSITASGLTTGTAIYTFDDLPDRLRRSELSRQPSPKEDLDRSPLLARRACSPRVRIGGLGLIPEGRPMSRDSIGLAVEATLDCLEKSLSDRKDIDLLIHTGVYRNNGLSEPAIAAIIAGKAGINDAIESLDRSKTLAFDLFNSGIGFLNAIHVATQMIRAGRSQRVMIVASEIENNAEVFIDDLRGLKETGSAMILEAAKNDGTGFGNFVFKDFINYIDALVTYARHERGTTYLHIERKNDVEDCYLNCIPLDQEIDIFPIG